jgi:hypothetical protein
MKNVGWQSFVTPAFAVAVLTTRSGLWLKESQERVG